MLEGRARGHQERIILLAYQTEAMAREKRLKPLKSYLRKPCKGPPQNVEVVEMFKRLATIGAGVRITEIERPED